MIIDKKTVSNPTALKGAIRNAIESTIADVANERTVAQLYRTSIYAKGCADFWAQNVADVDWIIKDKATGETLAPDSPHILNLMVRSAEFQEALRKAEYSLRFYGWAVLRKLRNIRGGVVALEFIYPQQLAPIINADGLVGWRVFNDYLHENQHIMELAREDAVFLREFDFDNEFDGVSSGDAAFLAGATETEMASTVLHSFRNAMVPALLIMPATDNPSVKEEEEAKNLMGMLRRFGRGAVNAARTFVSPIRWIVERLQPPYKDIDMTPLSQDVIRKIAAAFNLSPAFITIGESHFNEQEGQYEVWQLRFFAPRMGWYGRQLTAELWLDFPAFAIEPNLDEVLKEDALQLTDLMERQSKMAAISLGEMQRLLGRKVLQGADDLYWADGVGWVPAEELTNLWKIKLLGAVGTVFGSQVAAQETGLPPEVATYTDTTSSVETPTSMSADTPPSHVNGDVSMSTYRPPAASYVPDSIYREMEVCARKSRKGHDFTPSLLHPATVATIKALTALGYQDTVVFSWAKTQYLHIMAAKAIQATRLLFEGEVEDILAEALAGNLKKDRFKRLLRAVIAKACRRAYVDGLTDGGVKNAELDEDEEDWLAAHISDQNEYVSGLADAIYLDNRVTPDEAVGKPEMWWNKSVSPAYQAGLLSAGQNMAMMWVQGQREEPCPDCTAMNGQVRRLKEFHKRGIIPKADKLNCKGFKCGCELLPTDAPIMRTRWPKIIGPAKDALPLERVTDGLDLADYKTVHAAYVAALEGMFPS